MFLQAEIGTAPAAEEENAAQLLLLSCLHSEKQECRFLLLQCHCCSTLFPTGEKRLAEGGQEAFALGFWLLGFWT
jgi:hypothetical protein